MSDILTSVLVHTNLESTRAWEKERRIYILVMGDYKTGEMPVEKALKNRKGNSQSNWKKRNTDAVHTTRE